MGCKNAIFEDGSTWVETSLNPYNECRLGIELRTPNYEIMFMKAKPAITELRL
jgi:hypothetical protein